MKRLFLVLFFAILAAACSNKCFLAPSDMIDEFRGQPVSQLLSQVKEAQFVPGLMYTWALDGKTTDKNGTTSYNFTLAFRHDGCDGFQRRPVTAVTDTSGKIISMDYKEK